MWLQNLLISFENVLWFKGGDIISAPKTEDCEPVQEDDDTIEKFNFEEHIGKC